MSDMQSLIYGPGGPFSAIAVVAAIFVGLLLSGAAAAVLLVLASMFAIGIVLANAVVRQARGRSRASWLDRGGWPVKERNPEPAVASGARALPAVATAYLPLNVFLEHRLAANVVLTFEQIESLLGFSLPAPAWTEREWWTTQAGPIDGHAETWTVTGRTATPNLLARTVAFTRAS